MLHKVSVRLFPLFLLGFHADHSFAATFLRPVAIG